MKILVTFGIVKEEDMGLYRKLVVGSDWRKQMPKLAISLGLGGNMPGMCVEFFFCFGFFWLFVICFFHESSTTFFLFQVSTGLVDLCIFSLGWSISVMSC